jgi:transcriptional regulator with XRE-family HTH domain
MTIDRKPRQTSGPAPEKAVTSPSAGKPTNVEQTVGERLRTAREAKGVDYYRVERDTKIRAKYLAALERSDHATLPGDVYTKGFVRSYAEYLGLSGDELVEAWRAERVDAEGQKPQIGGLLPLRMARRSFILLPNHFFLVILALVVAVFGGYFAIQIARLLTPISVNVGDPGSGRVTVDSTRTTYLLTGTASGGTTVEISWDGQPPTKVKADSSGHWTYLASLHAGVNQFEITARDSDTQHRSSTVVRLIEVPVSDSSPLIPGVVLSGPEDGSVFSNGTFEVTGKSVAVTTITITPVYIGPPPLPISSATPPPAETPAESPTGPAVVGTPTPTPPPTPRPSATPVPTPTPLPTPYPVESGASASPGPPAISKTVDIYGNFNIPMQLPPGQWLLTITGINGQGQESSPVNRVVTVKYSDVQVVVKVNGGPPGSGKTTIRAWKNDGDGLKEIGHITAYSAGKTLSFSGLKSVELYADCAGAISITVNGWPYTLSRYCSAGTWRLTATSPPRRI